MKTLREYLREDSVKGLKNHPLSSMEPETKKGLDWEYEREYKTYAKRQFPNAFKNRKHFQQEYDNAPLRHLSHHEAKNLGNSDLGYVLQHGGNKKKLVHEIIDGRRDVAGITHKLQYGKTTPPIVLKHKDGLHLLGGNTRLITGAAHGINVPVKIIPIGE